MMRWASNAVLLALIVFASGGDVAQATTISGSYDFTASDFIDQIGSAPAPVDPVTGSFSFSFVYPPGFDPSTHPIPLFIPTALDLTIGAKTYDPSETRVDLEFGDFSTKGEIFTHLAISLIARDDHALAPDHGFELVLVLNPDGSLWSGGNQQFGYDQNPVGVHEHFWLASTQFADEGIVTASCAEGECAVNDPPLAPGEVAPPVPVPEPCSLPLLAAGLSLMALLAYRKKRNAKSHCC